MVATEITKARQQLVAGMLYRVEVKIMPSMCMNTPENANKGVDECQPMADAVGHYCMFTIWFQSWNKDEEKRLRVKRIGCTVN